MGVAASTRAARSAPPEAAPEGGATRGVVTGKYFNFKPLPPPADVLGKPLVVSDLPTHRLPRETWRSRLQRILARVQLGRQSTMTLLRWKIHDTVASVLASISPAVLLPPDKRRAARGRGGPVPVVIVRHPYHLRHVFDLVLTLPDEVMAERRFLELLMGRILKKYGEQMLAMKGAAFSFENEAKEYLLAGFRLERQIKKISAPDERFIALQAIHTNYFHGRNYYLYALLRREKLAADSKLFMLFSRACYFMARIDWNGELLDKPHPRSVPPRRLLVFHLQRDKSVLARMKSDPEFYRQVKSVLDAFPD